MREREASAHRRSNLIRRLDTTVCLLPLELEVRGVAEDDAAMAKRDERVGEPLQQLKARRERTLDLRGRIALDLRHGSSRVCAERGKGRERTDTWHPLHEAACAPRGKGRERTDTWQCRCGYIMIDHAVYSR